MNKNLLNLILVVLVIVLICVVVNAVTTKENRLNVVVVVQGPINNYIDARTSIDKIESENTAIGDNNSISKEEKDV